MPKIPLYTHTPQSAGPMQVRADPHMLDAQFAAGQRVGQAVAGLGQVSEDAMVRMQQAQNYKYGAEVDIAMQEEWDNFQNGLNPSTDESKWVPEWQKRLDARVAKAMPKDAGPVLRQQLDLKTKEFRVRTSGDIGQQAKAAGVEKATLAGSARVDQLWRNGDAAGAEAELNRMAGLGLIFPEKIPALVQKGYSRMEQQQAIRQINVDPVTAHEELTEKTPSGRWKNFTKLDEDDRLTLINHARTQTTALQSANFEDLIDGLNNKEVKQPEELQAMVDGKLISAKQRKSYETAYRHGGFATSPVQIGQLFTDISNYDPQKDADQTGRAELLGRIATTGFPQNVQSEANELLGKKADPMHVLNSAVAKDAFESIDQRFKLGIYGKYETRKMITTGPMAGQWTTDVNPKVYETAMVTKRRVEDATRKFIQENPAADAAKVNQFISDVQLGETVKTGRHVLLSGLGLDAQPQPDDSAKAKKARLDAILKK